MAWTQRATIPTGMQSSTTDVDRVAILQEALGNIEDSQRDPRKYMCLILLHENAAAVTSKVPSIQDDGASTAVYNSVLHHHN